MTTDWSLSHKWATVLCGGPWISLSPPALSAPSLVLVTIWHWTSHWEEGECRGGNWTFAEGQSWTWSRSQAKLRGHQPSPAHHPPQMFTIHGHSSPFTWPQLTRFHNRLGLPHLTRILSETCSLLILSTLEKPSSLSLNKAPGRCKPNMAKGGNQEGQGEVEGEQHWEAWAWEHLRPVPTWATGSPGHSGHGPQLPVPCFPIS